jgi:hypothetical protein
MPASKIAFDADNPEWTEEDFARAKGPQSLSDAERSAFPATFDDEDDAKFHLMNLENSNSPAVRESYLKLLVAGERAGLRTKPSRRGSKRSVHFLRGAEAPYGLIVNRGDILFYLRGPALAKQPSLSIEAERRFDETRLTAAGEVTIRLKTSSDADRISAWLFSANP